MSRRLETDMPSDLFYIINFSCVIIVSIIGLTFSFILIIIVIINRQCHNVSNLLACNTSIGVIFYLILAILSSIYGFYENWPLNSSLCVLRAYFFVVGIGIVCYSFSIQSLSRLFFAIHYKYKYLLTWRTHWIMIIINWIISFLIPIVPLFIDGSLGLEKESRNCVLKSNVFSASIFCTIMIIIIPLNVTIMVYSIILYHARQSTYRVLRFTQDMNNRIARSHVKRELKLAQHLLIQTACGTCGAIVFFINVLWQALSEIPLPKPMFLIGFNLTTIGISLITIAHFILNTKVKKIAFQHLCGCC